MDLIDRTALLYDLGEPHPMDYNAIAAEYKIKEQPTIEAVPLDRLCAWMAQQDFRVNGEPIVAKMSAETWRNVIRECVK